MASPFQVSGAAHVSIADAVSMPTAFNFVEGFAVQVSGLRIRRFDVIIVTMLSIILIYKTILYAKFFATKIFA